MQDIPATTAASEQQFSIKKKKKKSSWGKSKTLIFGEQEILVVTERTDQNEP